MGLLASCHGGTARRVADHLARQPPKPGSARRPAAQEQRPSLLARASFAHRQRQPTSPALLGNASVPDLPLSARLAVPPEYSRRRDGPLRETPVLFAIGPSNLVVSDRSEPLRRVHSRIRLLFWIGSKIYRAKEKYPPRRPSSWSCPWLTRLSHPGNCPPYRRHAPVQTPPIGNRILDSR